MSLAGKSDTIAEWIEKVRYALGSGSAGAVIPRAAISMRISSGVEFGSAGRAHRHSEIGPVENE